MCDSRVPVRLPPFALPVMAASGKIEERQNVTLRGGDKFSGRMLIADRIDHPLAGVLRHANGDVFHGSFIDGQGSMVVI